MLQLRGLLYVGFIVAMLIAWYGKRKKDQGTSNNLQKNTPTERQVMIPDVIEDALTHSDWMVRLEAVNTLLKKKNTKNMRLLLDMLSDPVLDIRSVAIAELATYGDEALTGLRDVLNTNNLSTRESAIQTLVAMQSSTTIPLLINALQNDISAWVRIPAAQGLGKIGGDEACDALIRALNDSHPDVLDAVHQALKHIGTPIALGALKV